MNQILAIDVGGTGIKGGIVDLSTGTLVSDRIKYLTPSPALPISVAETINKVIADLDWKDDIGMGFPSIISDNICLSANNIDKSWIGTDIKNLISEHCNLNAHILNDADAAGFAEVKYGSGKDVNGKVMTITLGTGIGSGLFINGTLVPNIEIGNLRFRDSIAEHYASNAARKREDMSWETYGGILNEFLVYVHRIFSADLYIISGGISKKFEKFSGFLDSALNVKQALLKNNAGIVGAASYASQQLK